MRSRLVLFLFFFMLVPPCYPQEFRATWSQVSRSTNSQIDSLFNNLQAVNQNAVLLLVSKTETIPTSTWNYIVNASKSRGIDLHLWMIMFGYDDNPNDPARRQYYKDAILRFADIYPGIRGIHLDYIRYPSTFTGTIDSSVVSNFVRDAYQSLKAAHPNILLSAAVGDYWWIEEIGQMWPDWLRGGYIDFVAIMNYSGTTDFNLYTYDKTMTLVDPAYKDRVFDGMAITPAEARYETDPATVEDRVIKYRAKGVKGFAFFDLPFSSSHVSRLSGSVFSSRVNPYYPGGGDTQSPSSPGGLRVINQ